MTFQPFVSVVTPVFNAEKYLSECIESILAQTYENWEYVIINNRSTDRSLEIAQSYAENDPRIRIHNNKEHLSLLQNWNHALRQISSESKYCKIVHADDWLFPDCITRMVELAESNPNVGIIGSYRLEETKVSCDGLPYSSKVVSGRMISRYALLGTLGSSYIFGSPTTLLFRSDLVRARKSFYNESNLHADTESCYDLLQEYDFGFVHQVLSYTRRHNESQTSFVRRLNTYTPSDLIMFKKYGPVYLSNQEFNEFFAKRIKNYYKFLGKSVFHRKGKEFWNYHKKELIKIGHPISAVKLCKSAFIVLYNRLLDKLKI